MAKISEYFTFNSVIPKDFRWLKNTRQYLRFHYRRFFCRQQLNAFFEYLDATPHWQEMFINTPFRFNTLLNKYADKRWGKTARFDAILQHFQQTEQYFGIDFCHRLVREKRIELFRLEDIVIYFGLNEIEPAEGFFAFSLYSGDTRVYNTSFTLLEGQCLIGSIQGSNLDNAQSLIKQVTKKLHGMRPMFMMIAICKLFCTHHQQQLLGIAHKNQAKYRFNDNTRLLFNYDEFWQENGAVFDKSSGFWQLDNHVERKPLEDIQSKKRSMYRKRYEMLDVISNQIEQLFSAKV